MRFFRYRLKTLFILVAIIAIGLFAGPRLWHRHLVNQATALVLNHGVVPAFGTTANPNDDTYKLLQSDVERVFDKFCRVLGDNTEVYAHQSNAANAIKGLLFHSDSAKLRSRWQRRLVELIVASEDLGSEELILELLADWIPSTGVSDTERTQLFAAAQLQPLTPGWAQLLIATGGRKELLLVLQHGGTHDQNLLWAIHNSDLIRLSWPGLLPYLEKWLDDPVVAECRVLDYGILSSHPRGRQILLAYATDSRNPIPLRQRALERLKENLAGITLLEQALSGPQASEVNEAFGGNATAAISAARSELEADQSERFWKSLIDGLDPQHWFPTSTNRVTTPEETAQLEVRRQQKSKASLVCLRHLANRTNLTTIKEWKEWYRVAKPGPVSQAQLLRAVIDNPALLSTNQIIRRILPWKLGEIPADCMPLYLHMAQHGTPAEKYWACQALLQFSDDLTAVPVAIEQLQNSGPSEGTFRRPGEVDILRSRFAENYFWDVKAWREWWKKYQHEAEAKEPREKP